MSLKNLKLKITMQYTLDPKKVEEYIDRHSFFKWKKILEKLKQINPNVTKINKNDLMRQFENEWFITSNINVIFDCSQLLHGEMSETQRERFGKLKRQTLLVKLSRFIKLARSEQHRLERQLGGAKGRASGGFKELRYETLDTHRKRYMEQLSKRKSDFIKVCIPKQRPVTAPSVENTHQSAPTQLNRGVPLVPLLPDYHSNFQPPPCNFGSSIQPTHQLNHPSQHRLVERDFEQELFAVTNELYYDNYEYVFSPIPFSYTD